MTQLKGYTSGIKTLAAGQATGMDMIQDKRSALLKAKAEVEEKAMMDVVEADGHLSLAGKV